MRVLDIFLTLLIAGMSGDLAIGVFVSGITPQSIFDDIGSDTTELSTGEFVQPRRFFDVGCERIGRRGARYNMFEDFVSELIACSESVISITEMKSVGRVVARYEFASKPLVGQYCRKALELKKCATKFADSVKPCVSPKEQNQVDKNVAAINLSLDYLCQEDGSRLRSFVATGGIECATSHEEDLLRCFDIIDNYSESELMIKFGSLHELSLKECRNIEMIRKCINTTLEDCVNPNPALLVNSVLDIFAAATPCREIIKEETLRTEEDSTPTILQVIFGSETEMVKNFFRGKCEENGRPGAYDDLKESSSLVMKSMEPLLNYQRFSREKTSNATLDPIVKEYCRRAPIINALDEYAMNSVKPCLEPEEGNSVQIFGDIRASINDFICYSGGNRLIRVMGTGGLECVTSRVEALLICFKRRFQGYINETWAAVELIGKLPLLQSAKLSVDLDDFRKCSNEVLADCETQDPSELMNSLIDFVQEKLSREAKIPAIEVFSTTIAPILRRRPQTGTVFLLLTGLKNARGMNMTDEEAELLIREECARNGGPNAYDAAKGIPSYMSRGSQLMEDYITERYGRIAGVGKFGYDNCDEKLAALSRDYCRSVPKVKMYLKHVEDIIPCLDSEGRLQLLKAKELVDASLEFICHNGGERIKRLLGIKSLQCIASATKNVKLCENQTHLPSRSPTTIIEQCRHEREKFKCRIKAVENCEDPAPKEILESYADLVMNILSCESLRPTPSYSDIPDIGMS